MRKSTACAVLVVAWVLSAAVPAMAQAANLTIWGREPLDGAAYNEYMTALIRDFQARNPDITIGYSPCGDGLPDKIKTAMAAGNIKLPDIFQSWGGLPMGGDADDGMLLDLTYELQEIPGSTAARKAMTWKGRIYGVAPFLAICGVFINEGIFKANGCVMPETIDQLEMTADILKRKGFQPFACGERDDWPGLHLYMYLVDRFGGGDAFPRALAGEIRFDADPFVKAAQLYQSWVKKGYFGGKPLEETYGDAMQLLATGKASMMVTGSWMCSMYSSESFTNQTIGFYAFPVVTGGMGSMTDVMGMTDLGFAATRQAESNKDAVVRFMTYAMSVKAGNTEPGRISSVPGVQAANPLAAMAAAILGKAEYAQSWWDQDLPAALVTPTSRMIRSFFLSRTDIQAELAKYAVLALENIEIANY